MSRKQIYEAELEDYFVKKIPRESDLKKIRKLYNILDCGESIGAYCDEYTYYYCITKKGGTDLGGSMEETLHRMIENGFSSYDIQCISGFTRGKRTSSSIDIDLGFHFPHHLVGYHETQIEIMDLRDWLQYLKEEFNVSNTDLQILRDSIEYLQEKKDFYENFFFVQRILNDLNVHEYELFKIGWRKEEEL